MTGSAPDIFADIPTWQWLAINLPGTLLALVMFFVYRKDQASWAIRTNETAQAFMEFGERYAKGAMEISANMREQAVLITRLTDVNDRQANVLERLELQLQGSHVCPVTQVTTKMLEDAIDHLDIPARRVGDQRITDEIRRTMRHQLARVEQAEIERRQANEDAATKNKPK